MTELLLEIWQKSYRAYDASRLQIALANLHSHHVIKRIRRLMKVADIYSVMVKRFEQQPNLIKHLKNVHAWSMDILYFKLTGGQRVYLASVLDFTTHKILVNRIK